MRILVGRLSCLCVSVLCCLFCLLRFSANSVNAYSGGEFMSASDALQIFGSTIECRYPHPSGSGYVTGHFNYSGLHTAPLGIHSTSGFNYTGGTFLMYTSDFNSVSSSPDYITIDIQPTYSIFDTTQIHSAILLSNVGYVNLSAYDSPFWDWNYNGADYHLEEHGEERQGNNILGYVTSDGVNYNYVTCDFTSQNVTSGYSYRAGFSGVQPSSGYGFRLLIGLPYVSTGATGTNGTFTTSDDSGGGGGGTSININVNVDNSGVESRLDDVNSGIADINSAIYGQSGQTMPYFDSMENPEYHFNGSTIDDIDQTLHDVPDVLGAASWWWNLAFNVLHLDSAIWSLVPILCILALISYMLWRW